MVDNDLPPLICLFEDKRKDAIGRPAFFLTTVKMILADDYSESFVETMDLQLREAESAHGSSVGVVMAILVKHTVDAAKDLVCDEKSVRRVFVPLNEALKVAFIPRVLLCHKDLYDVELLLGSGLQLIVLRVGRESNGKDKCKDCGVEA
jgi:hypothetical protein